VVTCILRGKPCREKSYQKEDARTNSKTSFVKIHHKPEFQFCWVLWRVHPPSALSSKEDIEKIQKHYSPSTQENLSSAQKLSRLEASKSL
jgi:hypothetical protein